MKIKGWRSAGILALLALAVFTADAFADDVSDDAAVEQETMFTLIKKGGPLMVPLALASILALALGVERFVVLGRERRLQAGFSSGLISAWKADPSGERAVEYCAQSDGIVSRILEAGVSWTKFGHEAVGKAIEDVGAREADKLKRSLRPLSVIATTSPLLGLLGTVYGMIEAFQKTSSSGGTAKTAALATGIYEALVTTAAGLTIAIPVLLLYQFLLGRVDKLIDEVEDSGARFVFTCAEGDPGESAAADSENPPRQSAKKAGV
jgi:biopolymer transport protein ExbB